MGPRRWSIALGAIFLKISKNNSLSEDPSEMGDRGMKQVYNKLYSRVWICFYVKLLEWDFAKFSKGKSGFT